MSDKLDAILSGQYDVYAAAREEYRKVIAEQEVKIDLLRKALVTCKGDWLKTMLENNRLRAALEYIAKGGLAYPEKHARAALEGKEP